MFSKIGFESAPSGEVASDRPVPSCKSPIRLLVSYRKFVRPHFFLFWLIIRFSSILPLSSTHQCRPPINPHHRSPLFVSCASRSWHSHPSRRHSSVCSDVRLAIHGYRSNGSNCVVSSWRHSLLSFLQDAYHVKLTPFELRTRRRNGTLGSRLHTRTQASHYDITVVIVGTFTDLASTDTWACCEGEA